MKQSSLFKLNWQDFFIGLLTASGSAVAAVIFPSIQAWVESLSTANPIRFSLIFNWTTIWHVAVAAAFGYFQVKFFSPAPKSVHIDPAKTSVIDKNTKQPILRSNNFNNYKKQTT